MQPQLSRWCEYTALAILLCSAPLFSCCAESSERNTSTAIDNVKRQNFSLDARLRYNSALADGVVEVNILVACRIGDTEEGAAAIESLGGKIGYRFDPVGYLWATIPTAQVPKLLTVPDIVDFQLDGPPFGVDYIEPADLTKLKPKGIWRRQKPLKALDEDMAKLPILGDNAAEDLSRYLPWQLLGVRGFLKDHPTFDGRGTTIAVVEGYGDLLHPVLQTALTLGGKPIAKVAGILDASSDEDSYYDDKRHNYDPPTQNIVLTSEIESEGNVSAYSGLSFILPGPGSYKIARFENDGRAFWVLWSVQRQSVWVDTNQNNSFADEVELKDINRQFSAAEFPAEKGFPGQDLATPTSFAVSIDVERSRLTLFLFQDDHATGVASIAAGKGFFGSQQDGGAPGARILYVTTGSYSIHERLKAFILAASRPDVDVVTASFVSKPIVPGETVTSLILDRLARVYQKPMFFTVTAASSATTDDISDQGTGPHVFGIMGYAPPEVWSALYGVKPPLRDNDPDGQGEGPAINGSIKPDFLAPFYQIAAENCQPPQWEADTKLLFTASGYKLPPCYVEFGGTSGSTPAAAAVAALLISGAKQTGTAHDLERLSWAMRSGGKYLDQMPEPVGYQGFGLPNVQESWRLLSSEEETPAFVITTRSNGPHENERKLPHAGRGVYEYSNWHPGMIGETVVTIRRAYGQSAPQQYLFKWRGNDGTFSVPQMVTLPLNVAVTVPVRFALKESGVHQAILEISDPANGIILDSFLNTVVASQPLSTSEPTTWHARLPLAHESCAMFDVQKDTNAIAAELTIRGGPGWVVAEPSGSDGPGDMLNYLLPYQEPMSIPFKKAGTKHVLIAHPNPGPFAFCIRNHPEVNVHTRDEAAYIEADIKLEAFRVNVEPTGRHVSRESNGAETLKEDVRLTNLGAPLHDVDLTTEIGYEVRYSLFIPALGQTSEFNFDVGADTRQLLLQFERVDTAMRLGVSIFACSRNSDQREHCKLQDYRENPQLLEYKAPERGSWKVLVCQIGAPSDISEPMAHVDVVQVTNGGTQAASVRSESQKAGLAVERLGSMDLPVSFHLQSRSAAGEPVAVIEVHDLNEEREEASSREAILRFHTERLRPTTLGRLIDSLPQMTSQRSTQTSLIDGQSPDQSSSAMLPK